MKAYSTNPNVILAGPNAVKTRTSVNQNVEESDLFVAVLSAQNVELQSVIGNRLLWKLQDLVSNAEINNVSNTPYKVLLDNYIIPYLCTVAAMKVIPVVQFKIRNKGLVTTSDDKVYNAAFQEMKSVMELLRTDSVTYANILKEFLTKNRSDFPELTSSTDSVISSDLTEQYASPWVID